MYVEINIDSIVARKDPMMMYEIIILKSSGKKGFTKKSIAIKRRKLINEYRLKLIIFNTP